MRICRNAENGVSIYMKKMSICQVAWIFAGSVLGAGLVSGQELWRFCGSFGKMGWAGLIVAVFLFMLFGMATFVTAKAMNTAETDKIVLPFDCTVISMVVCIIQLIFFITLVAIMLSGAGELISTVVGLPKWSMCLIVAVLTVAISFGGINGVAVVFSLCVPLIALTSVTFAIKALADFGGINYIPQESAVGAVPNWLAAAVTYASCNSFACLGVLCPFAVNGGCNKKTLLGGAALGTAILTVISAAILTVLYLYPDAASHGMPMLTAAYSVSPVFGCIYGLLLLMGLLQTAISGMTACNTYIFAKLAFADKRRGIVRIVIGMVAFLLSLSNFSSLIDTVYPAFGYVNAFFTAGMLANLLRLKKYGQKNDVFLLDICRK